MLKTNNIYILKKILFFLVKVGITLLIFQTLSRKVDLASIYEGMRSGINEAYIYCILLLLLNNILVGLRWGIIVRSMSQDKIEILDSIKISFVGLLFGQILPGAIGGDAVKAWLAWKAGVSHTKAISSIIIDRGCAIIILVLFIFLAVPLLSDFLDRDLLFNILSICGLLLFLFILLFTVMFHYKGRPFDLANVGRAIFFENNRLKKTGAIMFLLKPFFISALINIFTIMVVYCLGKMLSINMSLAASFAVVPLSLLISALPFSLSGWGVREGIMVVVLGFFGVSAANALEISILLGFGLLFSTLPGVFFFFLGPRLKLVETTIN